MKRTIQLLACLTLLASCSTKPRKSDAEIDRIVDSTLVAKQQQIVEKKMKALTEWKYETSKDEMSSETTTLATLMSTNHVNLDFPYEGGTWMSLYVRKVGNDLDIYCITTNGQINTDYQNPVIKLRFDDEAPFNNYVTESNSNESNIRFFSKPSALLQKLKTHKALKVEVIFYNQGSFVYNFDISNLKFE